MQVKRTKGKRRWDSYPEFPLTDNSGVIVISDRRRISDRRLHNTTLEDRLLMLAEMPPPRPDNGNGYNG